MNIHGREEYQAITGEYKKQFIDDVLNGMQGFLDNKQLTELNKSLYRNTTNLDFADNPKNRDLNYQKTNKILIKEFLKTKKTQGLSINSLKLYEGTLKKFNEWCIKSFLEITSEDLREFLIFHQKLNNCSKATTDNIRRNLSSFFRYLTDEEKILINPILRIPPIKEVKKVRKAFTYAEIELMRWELQEQLHHKGDNELHFFNVRNLAIFELFLSSGIRVGELVKIKIEDLNLVECKCIVLGKGNKERVIYYSERAKNTIIHYLRLRDDNNPYLFTASHKANRDRGKPMTTSSINDIVKSIGKNAGVKECHCHKFRRTFCSQMIKKGMPIDQVQQLMGHESIEVTLRYVDMDNDTIELTHKKFTNF